MRWCWAARRQASRRSDRVRPPRYASRCGTRARRVCPTRIAWPDRVDRHDKRDRHRAGAVVPAALCGMQCEHCDRLGRMAGRAATRTTRSSVVDGGIALRSDGLDLPDQTGPMARRQATRRRTRSSLAYGRSIQGRFKTTENADTRAIARCHLHGKLSATTRPTCLAAH
jgi:hypothetical protein